MSSFLQPIAFQLKILEQGMLMRNSLNVSKNIRFFLIAAVFDKPAKADVLNMKSCNGFGGCTKCMQLGETFRTENGKLNKSKLLIKIIIFKYLGGNIHIYPYSFENPTGPKRTDEIYKSDVKDAITKSTVVNGVKGFCCLSYLEHFKPISGTCIDYMHSVLEGVVKSLMRLWFSSEYKQENFSLFREIDEIESRLKQIHPPKFVPRKPNSIYSFTKWHAHEYLAFIIYYALPLFQDIMDKAALNHLTKLVIFLEIILSRKINIKYLDFAQNIIESFGKDFAVVYLKQFMLSGVHELLHLVECTKQFGPLNNINCFQFEELNRKVVNCIHGRDLIGEEFIKIFSIIQLMSYTISKLPTSSTYHDFIVRKMNFKSSNRKNYHNSKCEINTISSSSELTDLNKIKLIELYFSVKIEKMYIYSKISYNSVIYSAFNNKLHNCDSCFITNDGKIGVIEDFFFQADKLYAIAKRASRIINLFCADYPEIKTQIFLIHISCDLFIVDINKIKKAALIQFSNDRVYVSQFSISHLFN